MIDAHPEVVFFKTGKGGLFIYRIFFPENGKNERRKGRKIKKAGDFSLIPDILEM